jgi:uncharacterized membrane protein
MGAFTSIIMLLAFTPLGFIRLPLINATMLHIPVIVGSVLLGWKYGAVLGFVFGLTSLINNTIAPGLISFVFSPAIPVPPPAGDGVGSLSALIVCFVPRILVGITPWLVYSGLRKFPPLKKSALQPVNLIFAGIIGSMTNTLLVMHLIYALFRQPFAQARELASDAVYGAILAVIAANGIPEAIAAAVLAAAICTPLLLLQRRHSK